MRRNALLVISLAVGFCGLLVSCSKQGDTPPAPPVLKIGEKADANPAVAAQDQEPIKDLQIGVSGRYGVRDANYVLYDAPALTTEGGYRFWAPGYGVTHVIPSGTQLGFAGELRVPFGDFDVTGEFIYVKNNTREANEGTLQNSLRFGDPAFHHGA